MFNSKDCHALRVCHAILSIMTCGVPSKVFRTNGRLLRAINFHLVYDVIRILRGLIRSLPVERGTVIVRFLSFLQAKGVGNVIGILRRASNDPIKSNYYHDRAAGVNYYIVRLLYRTAIRRRVVRLRVDEVLIKGFFRGNESELNEQRRQLTICGGNLAIAVQVLSMIVVSVSYPGTSFLKDHANVRDRFVIVREGRPYAPANALRGGEHAILNGPSVQAFYAFVLCGGDAFRGIDRAVLCVVNFMYNHVATSQPQVASFVSLHRNSVQVFSNLVALRLSAIPTRIHTNVVSRFHGNLLVLVVVRKVRVVLRDLVNERCGRVFHLRKIRVDLVVRLTGRIARSGSVFVNEDQRDRELMFEGVMGPIQFVSYAIADRRTEHGFDQVRLRERLHNVRRNFRFTKCNKGREYFRVIIRPVRGSVIKGGICAVVMALRRRLSATVLRVVGRDLINQDSGNDRIKDRQLAHVNVVIPSQIGDRSVTVDCN